MKWLVIPLLGIIFIVLLAGSVQSISADLPEPFVFNVELKDSKYQVYVQIVHRNEGGQLISVTESSLSGAYLPHKITDDIFDTLMGKKEIIIIDNIKYEKVQYTSSPTLVQRTVDIYPIFEEIPLEQFTIYDMDEDTLAQMNENIKNYYRTKIHYCATFEGHAYTCIPVFQGFTTVRNVTPTDVVTHQWTILRVLG